MKNDNSITLPLGLVDEEGKKLSGEEFVKWMNREMKVFVVECNDDTKKLPSEWLKQLELFWAD